MTSFNRVLRHSLLVLAAALPWQPSFAEPTELDRVVAVVNDGIVLQSELESRTALIREQMQARNTQPPSDQILRRQVLERLITDSIQLQLAERQGIRVTDQELNNALQNIAEQNKMTLAQFREALIAEGRDYAQAREQIRQEMLLARVQQANVNRRISVSDQEVRNYLASDQANDTTEYLLSNILLALPQNASPEVIQSTEAKANSLHQQLQQGAAFADLAIANSDASNALNGGELGWRARNELPQALAAPLRGLTPGQFTAPIRTPSGFHLLLLRDKRGAEQQLIQQTLVSHILIAPSEIRSTEQSRLLAEDLYRRLQDGQPFDELARQYSDDPASGSQGGDLGWTQQGQMVPEFEQMMLNTPKGAISTPFESRFGWHILTVRDRRTEDVGTEMRENRARNAIRARKFNEELDNWLRELRSQAYIDRKDVVSQ